MRTIFSNAMPRVLGIVMVLTLVLAGTSQARAGTYFFHNDHLGTPQAVTDVSQQTVWQAESHPFGEVTETVSQIEQNLRFPGQYFDSETGLHYNYFRDYDSLLGRYVESDPIGLRGGPSTYGYAYQQPTYNIDPDGRVVIVAPWVINTGFATATALALWWATNNPNAPDASDYGSILPPYRSEAKDDSQNDDAEADICPTPETDGSDFENVRKSKAKRNKKTGEYWEKDLLHKDHWEVQK